MGTRIEYDAELQAEVSVRYKEDGLVVTFGAIEPTHTGSWGVFINALRLEAKGE